MLSQVYGAIMFVFDILVLFLCCRRGARRVSIIFSLRACTSCY